MSEFVELTEDPGCGAYPTIWCDTRTAKRGEPANKAGQFVVREDDPEAMRDYKDAICNSALDCYEQGADGVSTFDWNLPDTCRLGLGTQEVGIYLYPKLGDPEALRRCLAQETALPEGCALPWEPAG